MGFSLTPHTRFAEQKTRRTHSAMLLWLVDVDHHYSIQVSHEPTNRFKRKTLNTNEHNEIDGHECLIRAKSSMYHDESSSPSSRPSSTASSFSFLVFQVRAARGGATFLEGWASLLLFWWYALLMWPMATMTAAAVKAWLICRLGDSSVLRKRHEAIIRMVGLVKFWMESFIPGRSLLLAVEGASRHWSLAVASWARDTKWPVQGGRRLW
jgi:hypothetical protein